MNWQKNPMALMQIKNMLDRFKANHPKFPKFLKAAAEKTGADSVIEITVTTADGETISGNIRVTEEDMELIRQIKEMA